MTLLIQTDGQINARRRRRNKARREQLDNALSTAFETAIEKVLQAPRQEIQTGVNVGGLGVLSVGPGPRPSTLAGVTAGVQQLHPRRPRHPGFHMQGAAEVHAQVHSIENTGDLEI